MHTWMAVMVILLLTGVLAADVVAGRGRGDSRHEGPTSSRTNGLIRVGLVNLLPVDMITKQEGA